jgi:curved DNA-binding protein CbpA
MADVDPIFLIEAEALANIIDELDYFQILKVDRKAKPDEVKTAYFRESRLYHPDQFFRMQEGPPKRAIGKIYKRVNEAWVVLSDDTKRTKYLADITGSDRAKKLRYTETSEEELKRSREAEMGTTPHGRKTFQQGLLDLEAGRVQQAITNFKLAIQFEPQNAFFRQKLTEASRLIGTKR